MFKECTNPLCENPIEADNGKSWRRTPKKFCCDECKTDVWALRKAADLLYSIPADKKLEVLELVASPIPESDSNEQNQDQTRQDNQREINGGNELKTCEVRRYSCHRWPRLRILGKVRFCGGFFETSYPELMSLVEQNEAYGAQILKIECWSSDLRRL